MEPKGVIHIAEILPGGSGVVLGKDGEFSMHMQGRVFSLRAENVESAKEWVSEIQDWVKFLSSSD